LNMKVGHTGPRKRTAFFVPWPAQASPPPSLPSVSLPLGERQTTEVILVMELAPVTMEAAPLARGIPGS
jgi:hypothetical protein